jgi:DNA modification methylase
VPERFLDDRVTLHCGDCIEVLATLPENSVDACCTDPPYHLVSIVKRMSKDGSAPVGFGSDGRYQRLSGGFMGSKWDGGDIAFRPELWCEVLRVLKPGAHLLAFGGTRTFHRMACAIEDAGFEIRDCVQWLYGSGFPKSHDVSKGIDKAAPRVGMFDGFAEHFSERLRGSSKSQREIAALFPSKSGGLTGCVWNWANGTNVPTVEQWALLQPLLGLSLEWLPLIERIEAEREIVGRATDGSSNGSVVGLGTLGKLQKEYDITSPATDAARQWQGWGTALKPACELIVLARKPLSEGTVAANVLRWGTGAINVDGCRVGTEATTIKKSFNKGAQGGNEGWDRPWNKTGEQWEQRENTAGRWPANVIHDGSEEVVGAFPESISGTLTAEHRRNGGYSNNRENEIFGKGSKRGCAEDAPTYAASSGSAARFFYTVKQDEPCRSIDSASDADERLSLQSERVVSALGDAVAQSTARLALKHQSVRARDMNVSASELGLIVASVTETIQNIERRFSFGLPRERLLARLGLVTCAAIPNQIGITTITISLLKSDHSVEVVTFDIIETSGEVGVKDFAKRFHYTAKADQDDRIGSRHPTIKPLDLIQYLVRLITPPKGICLDPFAGTGTLGEAAWREGMRAVLIEREEEYQQDIRRRMALILAGPDERTRESIKAKNLPRDDGPLFDWTLP